MDRATTFLTDRFGENAVVVVFAIVLIIFFVFFCNCFNSKSMNFFDWSNITDVIGDGAEDVEGFMNNGVGSVDLLENQSNGGYKRFVSHKGLLPDGKYLIRGGRERRYCTDDANGLICSTETPGPLEIFTLQHLDGEKYAIQGYRSGLWCTQTRTGLRCESPVVSDWEVFRFHPMDDGTYGIQSNRNGQWCADMGNGMVCDTPSMNGWDFQKFEFIPVRYNNIK